MLLVFDSFNKRDRFMLALGEHESVGNDSLVEVCEDTFATRYGRFMTCVPRTPNGKIGFMHKISQLFHQFEGIIIIMAHELTVLDFGHENIPLPPSCKLNPPIQELSALLGVQFNDDQRLRLSRLTAPSPAAHLVTRLRELYNFGQRNPPPAVVGNNNDEDDALLNEGIRLSMEEYERANTKAKPLVPLSESYKAVLKLDEPPEPLKPGQAKCTICLNARATICFVNCGHLVGCDHCINIMWTRTDVAHACTVCRTPCTQIVRPHPAAIEEEEPIEKPKRKKRKQRK